MIGGGVGLGQEFGTDSNVWLVQSRPYGELVAPDNHELELS
jgi:hypothetical protein